MWLRGLEGHTIACVVHPSVRFSLNHFTTSMSVFGRQIHRLVCRCRRRPEMHDSQQVQVTRPRRDVETSRKIEYLRPARQLPSRPPLLSCWPLPVQLAPRLQGAAFLPPPLPLPLPRVSAPRLPCPLLPLPIPKFCPKLNLK